MSSKLDLESTENNEFVERVVVRLMGQSKFELEHVLKNLFPNAPSMRLKAVAEDFSEKRSHVQEDFLEMVKSIDMNIDVFRKLASADVDPLLIMSRKMNDPTKFQITLTCSRTPFKEFFEECKEISCENCIEGRITNFKTDNDVSAAPWVMKIDKVEQRRLDICKKCGEMLIKGSNINLQNERLLYTCKYCGHKGWTKAK